MVGELVASVQHASLDGRKLLWVRDETGRCRLAVDSVDAGPGDRVLVLDEGNGAAQVLEASRGPIRTVIVGVVDAVETGARK